ncbi:MAG: hypothetical protein AAFO82_07685, partial [Bacteroidota bacterium]
MNFWIKHLPTLINELRLEGIRIGLVEYTLLQNTLLELSKVHAIPEKEDDIRSVLSTILCKNQKQVAIFNEIYEKW